jgi:hypothetical protein
MAKKYVKDRAHNRYEAYCCDDIDARVGALEDALAALVAGTVPDGAVTLAKMAEDARSWSREINKGRLVAEWIGTRAEYNAHVAGNGGAPLTNVKYIITDDAHPVGSIVTVGVPNDDPDATKTACTIGEVQTRLGRFNASVFYSVGVTTNALDGSWRCLGACGTFATDEGGYDLYLFKRVE